MKRSIFACGALVWALLACHQAPRPDDPKAQRPDDPTAEAPAQKQRKLAELSPELISKAEDILRSNPGVPFGTEFPFDLGGRKYVARVEVHDNPDGDPRRPIGQHKGITVYSED